MSALKLNIQILYYHTIRFQDKTLYTWGHNLDLNPMSRGSEFVLQLYIVSSLFTDNHISKSVRDTEELHPADLWRKTQHVFLSKLQIVHFSYLLATKALALSRQQKCFGESAIWSRFHFWPISILSSLQQLIHCFGVYGVYWKCAMVGVKTQVYFANTGMKWVTRVYLISGTGWRWGYTLTGMSVHHRAPHLFIGDEQKPKNLEEAHTDESLGEHAKGCNLS